MIKVARREFIKLGAASSLGLMLGVPVVSADPGKAVSLRPLIRVGTDNRITVYAQNPDMGQGVKTSLPMIIAEELDVDWSKIRIEQADWDPQFENQFSGGSLSVRLNFTAMRQAGASARQMLLQSAAKRWQVPISDLEASMGIVRHAASKRQSSYGDLAEAAATLPVPDDPVLKDIADFELIGQPIPDVDLSTMLDGSLQFSSDLKLPNMLYAAVKRSPCSDGQPGAIDSEAARNVDGVVGIEVLRNDEFGGRIVFPNSPNFVSGVAILAESTWAAMKAAKLVNVEWRQPDALDDSDALFTEFEDALSRDAALVRSDGNATQALASLPNTIDSTYRLPFLAHVPMEAMNCTADVGDDGITLWAPTQQPGMLAETVAVALGVATETITVHVLRSGGAFGRRYYADFAVEAAVLSRKAGRPVKVVWTREDDIAHDYFRPASIQRIRAGCDSNGQITGWHHKVISYPRGLFLERDSFAELENYEFPAGFISNLLLEYGHVKARIPLGQWRAIEHSSNVFAVASAIDEVAHLCGQDPVVFLSQLIGKERYVQVLEDFRFEASRLLVVLEKAAKEANWGTPLPAGHGRGIAVSYNQGAWVAEVAEVAVTDRKLRVKRITAAVDCGLIVNPNGAEAQVEGAIIEGMAAALLGEITVRGGVVEQSNFHNYQFLRMNETPEISIHFIKSDDAPRGLGEGPLPPVAPAICNAIFAAIGERIRTLPVRLADNTSVI